MLSFGRRAFLGCSLVVAVVSACGGRSSKADVSSGGRGGRNTGGTGGINASSGGTKTVSRGGTDSAIPETEIQTRTDPEFVFPVPQGAVLLDSWAEKSAESMCAFLSNARKAVSRGNYRGEPCVSYFTNFYRDVLDLEALVAEGRVVYEPNSFGECLEEFARSTFRPVDSIPCILRLGGLSEGASCNASLECEGTMTCRFDQTRQNGTCQKRSILGEDCSVSVCARGLYCREGTCHEQVIDGTHCELWKENSECLIGAYCLDVNVGDYTGECRRPKLAKSSGCAAGYTNQITGQEYDDYEGDYVDSYSCLLRSLTGESCVAKFDDACTYDSYCYPDVCQLRAQLGESCEPLALNACVYGTRCDQTRLRCVDATRGKSGDPCAVDDDCYSRRCNVNQCERAKSSAIDLMLLEGTAIP